MARPPPLPDEARPLVAPRSYALIDPDTQRSLARLAGLAAAVLAAPAAAVSLADERRERVVAGVGLDLREMPRAASFAVRALGPADVLAVPDLARDPRFAAGPRGLAGMRFLAAVPLRAAAGAALGALCVLDTRPREAPDARQAAALRDVAALVTEELERPRAGARLPFDAPRGPGGFLAELAHELRTPLNAVLGFARLIEEGSDPTMAGFAGEITGAGRHMLDLVGDLAEYGRAGAGAPPVRARRTRVATAVDQAARLVAPLAEAHGVALDSSASFPEAEVRGSSVRVRQVLLNLLANAIKATPAGGRVRLSLARGPEDAVLLEVSDTGAGMTPEQIRRALAPFGRRPGRGRTPRAGGLGLPIARAIVEAHGGRLELRSAPDQGTTARVLLPALPPRRGPSPQLR